MMEPLVYRPTPEPKDSWWLKVSDAILRAMGWTWDTFARIVIWILETSVRVLWWVYSLPRRLRKPEGP